MIEKLIEQICRRCPYFKKGCWFDEGDSITKIPCEALRILALERMRLKMESSKIHKEGKE